MPSNKNEITASKQTDAISGIDAIAAATTIHDSTLNWATGNYVLTKGPGEPGIPESAKGISAVDETANEQRQEGLK